MALETEKGGPQHASYDMGEPKAQLYDDKGMKRSNMEQYDPDGHVHRTGQWVVAYAHIVCAVIGSGVLSLAWGVSWLGWIAGPIVLFAFAWVTYFCSSLLIDAYRYPDVDGPTVNYKYIDAVERYMGRGWSIACGTVQYINMVGTAIGYTVTGGIAATAIRRSNCFHANGDVSGTCEQSATPWIIMFGAMQLVLSQLPDIDRIWILSALATIMSFTYSGIGLGLCIAMDTERGAQYGTGTADGIPIDYVTTTPAMKAYGIFQALGDIAFAYSFSFILIEITDTIAQPNENAKMKKATLLGIATTTFFYACIGIFGYAAFGNSAPGNLISGFGFYNPYWLIDIANAAIYAHLLGAYQVWIQPFYGFVDLQVFKRFPNSKFLQYDLFAVHIPGVGLVRANPFRLIWRTIFVILVTLVACLLPFFNDIVALLGSIGFGPLTVFFPIEMHIKQKKIKPWSPYWIALETLNMICQLVSLVACIGAVEGIYQDCLVYTPFNTLQG